MHAQFRGRARAVVFWHASFRSAFLGGTLTILSPCVLPIIANVDRHGVTTGATRRATEAAPSRRGACISSPARGAITDRTFEIELIDPGVSVYAFTFG